MSDPTATIDPLTDKLDPNVIVGPSPLSTKRYLYRGFELELDSVHSTPADQHRAVLAWRRRIDDLYPLEDLDSASPRPTPKPKEIREPRAFKPFAFVKRAPRPKRAGSTRGA